MSRYSCTESTATRSEIVQQKKLPNFRIISPSGLTYYHCKPCVKYLAESEFYKSYLTRRFRYCKACVLKRNQELPLLNKLKKKIYKELYNRGDRGLAQLLTINGVNKVLTYYNINAKDVMRIEIPTKIDELLDFKYYKVIKL